MKECCETGEPKKRYWHWVALGVVLLIAGVLQLIPNQVPIHGMSFKTRSKADVSAIVQSLTEYAINNKDAYPATLTPLVTPDANGHCYLEGYNGKIPKDPWKHEYLYTPPTPEHPKPRVWSFGADGKPGGSGDDADVDSDFLAERY